MGRTGVMADGGGARTPSGTRRAAHRVAPSTVAVVVAGLALAGCGIHVSKHGVSGNILGHSFSGESGSLPAGFPSGIPAPGHSRVLGGGGVDDRWDAAYAVTGNVTAGMTAYEGEFRTSGFTVTDAENGTTPITSTAGATGSSTSTTVTVDGSVFTARDAQWTVEVVGGSTTAPTTGTLKSGEFAINVTVVATSSIPTTTG